MPEEEEELGGATTGESVPVEEELGGATGGESGMPLEETNYKSFVNTTFMVCRY